MAALHHNVLECIPFTCHLLRWVFYVQAPEEERQEKRRCIWAFYRCHLASTVSDCPPFFFAGLDAFQAERVMKTLKALAAAGHTGMWVHNLAPDVPSCMLGGLRPCFSLCGHSSPTLLDYMHQV